MNDQKNVENLKNEVLSFKNELYFYFCLIFAIKNERIEMCGKNGISFPAKINSKSLDYLFRKTEGSSSSLKIKLTKFDGETVDLKIPSKFSFFDLKCEVERYHNKI